MSVAPARGRLNRPFNGNDLAEGTVFWSPVAMFATLIRPRLHRCPG